MVQGKVKMHARAVTNNERFIYPSGDSEVQLQQWSFSKSDHIAAWHQRGFPHLVMNVSQPSISTSERLTSISTYFLFPNLCDEVQRE